MAVDDQPSSRVVVLLEPENRLEQAFRHHATYHGIGQRTFSPTLASRDSIEQVLNSLLIVVEVVTLLPTSVPPDRGLYIWHLDLTTRARQGDGPGRTQVARRR